MNTGTPGSDAVGRYELLAEQVIEANIDDVYRALVEPAAQLEWNTLYLEVHVDPPGPIGTGTHLTGRFKGSGRADVTFLDVVPGQRFTHHSGMRVPGTPVPLGLFDHTYSVAPTAGGTQVLQHVLFRPAGLGRLLAPLIMESFRRRLPASFDELRGYVERPAS